MTLERYYGRGPCNEMRLGTIILNGDTSTERERTCPIQLNVEAKFIVLQTFVGLFVGMKKKVKEECGEWCSAPTDSAGIFVCHAAKPEGIRLKKNWKIPDIFYDTKVDI